jgi:FkbM family methyltransferase
MNASQYWQIIQTLILRVRGRVHDGDFASFSRLALQNPLIVDVGANSGQSIASFKHIFPDSRIESFEANPFFFPVLNVVKSWYSNVVVHNFGLGSEEGTLDFHVPIVDGKPILQEGSTRRDYFENNWVIERLGRYGRQLEFDVFPVEIRRGDQLLIDQPVDIVKIDVEGAELDVLSSMIGLIENSHPLFLVENSDY